MSRPSSSTRLGSARPPKRDLTWSLALARAGSESDAEALTVDEVTYSAEAWRSQSPADGDSKPAWIVDGQQRSVCAPSSQEPAFPVPVAAFVADTVDVQRDQFVRINSARPSSRRPGN